MSAILLPTRTALVIAPASIWRDALVSLVRAQPHLCISAVLDNFEAARTALERQAVDVVIAENGLDETTLLNFVAWLHATHVAARCVVAVDTQLQQARCRAAGAHATLLKGCLDDALLRRAVAV
ncbi:MAG: hypothetical protein WAU00_12415 [Caldilinea sp.]|uniref:hypothetical protein n=1 Tax=Caldilinea sp. TaxID=2293560 RepID=UPI002CAA9B1C|nr:hypothetical protein [Caldilinea sp.]HRA65131.1 hypothetical protein [Caldilinea sp.]